MNIEELQQFCLSLPAVTQDVKWDNDLVFSVGTKMFCIAALTPPMTCSFKVPDDIFEELSVQPHFVPAPYMARAKWVQVTDASVLTRKEWEAYLQQSYQLVVAKLTKKVKSALEL